jgi:hypothetical protein
MKGIEAQVQAIRAGAVTDIYGYRTVITVTGAPVTTARGIHLPGPVISGGGTITTLYGIQIANQGAAGVTTSYGLFIAAQSGATTSYGLYVAGGLTYLAGNLQLADTDIVLGTTTGTKIATTATQKLAFYGATPRVRPTGWGAATGTKTRTTFDPSTVTLPQLAERVAALIDDLHATAGVGLIGA